MSLSIQVNNDSEHDSPLVLILLCTYQGEKFLEEQLKSFESQTYKNWQVIASDDGSTDKTLPLLKFFQDKWGDKKLSIIQGPKKGYVANFLSLITFAKQIKVEADFFAFSDQDDIWNHDKLEKSLDWLITMPKNIPSLYCSRTQLVDADNKDIGYSPLFTKLPSFQNALVQSIAGGNTMVFNRIARDLLAKAGHNISVVSHDWWAYILITGYGGSVFYDQNPSIRYRQHESNVIGMNANWMAKILRLRMLLRGDFREYNNQHIESLQKMELYVTDTNKIILSNFIHSREKNIFLRFVYFWKSGAYRQNFLGNLALFIALIFNKV
jgi:glycosyltransferase involved in cell wall biosynthesis